MTKTYKCRIDDHFVFIGKNLAVGQPLIRERREIMSDLLQNIIISVITSLVASLIFCFLSFRYTGVDIWFRNKLIKSPSTGEHYGNYRYRIMLGNSGLNDLLEISIKAKITVTVREKSHFTYLDAGNQGFLPVLAGKKVALNMGIILIKIS